MVHPRHDNSSGNESCDISPDAHDGSQRYRRQHQHPEPHHSRHLTQDREDEFEGNLSSVNPMVVPGEVTEQQHISGQATPDALMNNLTRSQGFIKMNNPYD